GSIFFETMLFLTRNGVKVPGNPTQWRDLIAESWQEFFEIINIPDSLPVVYSSSNISERVLASNESLELIDWSNKRDYNNSPLMEFIYERADKISVEICYSSIHGDLWKVKRVGFKSDLERQQRFEQTSCDAEAKIFRE
ncbi:MAG: hypothetical protein AAF361_08555, partial [Bacteroidota bacterium]